MKNETEMCVTDHMRIIDYPQAYWSKYDTPLKIFVIANHHRKYSSGAAERGRAEIMWSAIHTNYTINGFKWDTVEYPTSHF